MDKNLVFQKIIDFLGGNRTANIYSAIVISAMILSLVARIIDLSGLKKLIHYFALCVMVGALIFLVYRSIVFFARK